MYFESYTHFYTEINVAFYGVSETTTGTEAKLFNYEKILSCEWNTNIIIADKTRWVEKI